MGGQYLDMLAQAAPLRHLGASALVGAGIGSWPEDLRVAAHGALRASGR